jgi:hypothetical protein
MELNFTELDDPNNNKNYLDVNNYNTTQSSSVGNPNSYWDKHTEATAPKKKRVTYDDILSSLNLVVNPNGVLQYMTIKPNTDVFFQNHREPQYSQQNPQQQYSQQTQQTQQPLQQTPKFNSNPLEPQVKNSYIFNKYFKDYKDANNIQIEEPRRPQTIQEYNRMVFEERVRRTQERNRVAQIKSTKLLFENNSTIHVSKNNLYRMSFK